MRVSSVEIGAVFGRLTVTGRTRKVRGRLHVSCRCKCGNRYVVRVHSLTSGNTRSCGCYKLEKATHHGDSKRGGRTRLYSIWVGMLQRTENPKCRAFKRYGGRGITVCCEWHSYQVFKQWAMANGYKVTLTIERHNNNRGYCPSNCSWATVSEQNANRRCTNSTGHLGIYQHTQTGRYVVQFKRGGYLHYVGIFSTITAAKRARKIAIDGLAA